ncbi:MAG: L,D-transpeptidase [Cyanobacteria bacterium J06638_22]
MVKLSRLIPNLLTVCGGRRSPIRFLLLVGAAVLTGWAGDAVAQTVSTSPDGAVQTDATPPQTAPPAPESVPLDENAAPLEPEPLESSPSDDSPFNESLLNAPAFNQYNEPFFNTPLVEEPLPQEMALRITIDLSDRRLTLYQGDTVLHTYSIAVGREGWQTPTGEFEVQQMVRDPAWMNPFTREVIDGGHPNNPLGDYWIGFWTDGTNWVGMHGTPNPETVGTAASHGCIRLYNDDIQALFGQVSMGTPVTVVP